MDLVKKSVQIVVKELCESVNNFKFDTPCNNVQYSDNINENNVVRAYSIREDGVYSERRNISELLGEENVTELKIIIINQNSFSVSGSLELKTEIKTEIKKIKPRSSFVNPLNVYEIGERLKLEEIDNNYIININSPNCINYIRTEVDSNTADHVFAEYSGGKVIEEKEVRIVTTGNKFPQEEQSEYTEWGYQFASFEAFFSKKYFEEQFGCYKPTTNDYLVFIVVGRSYYVHSVTDLEGINGSTYGYKLSLKHFDLNRSIEGLEDTSIFDSMDTAEDLYFDNAKEEAEAILDEDQNLSKLINDDNLRYLVSGHVSIKNDPGIGNYYQTDSITEERESIIYSKSLNNTKNFSISFMLDTDNSTEEAGVIAVGGIIGRITSNNILNIIIGNNTYISTPLSIGWNHVLLNFYVDLMEIVIINNNSKDRGYVRFSIEPMQITDYLMALIHNQYKTARIRFWNKPVPKEFEKQILKSKFVEKVEISPIIDNVENILNTRTHRRSMLTSRNDGQIINRIYKINDSFSNIIIKPPLEMSVESNCSCWQ